MHSTYEDQLELFLCRRMYCEETTYFTPSIMNVTQLIWKDHQWNIFGDDTAKDPQICILFGTRETLEDKDYYSELRKKYPNADIVSCSTAGNIVDDELLDDVIVANCIASEKTTIKSRLLHFKDYCDEENEICGEKLGRNLVHQLDRKELSYLLILSSSNLNAGSFLNGLNDELMDKIPISGGVAGDNYKFEKTLVGLNEEIGENRIVAISFHGKHLETYHGSKGGWDIFGPERTITKAKGNVLYEIDGKPALDLYKKYLGEKSEELPGAALHFPFSVVDPKTNELLVRGVQNIDTNSNSIILFADVEEGSSIQLMKANFDRVIDGVHDAAEASFQKDRGMPDFAILISCVARRLVLNQLTEEELTEAKNILGEHTKISGFYSYSELSPIVGDDACHVHNQTMTITSFYEN